MDRPTARHGNPKQWPLSSLRRAADIDLHALLHADFESDWLRVREQLDRYFGDAPAAVNPGDRRALYYLARGLRSARVLEVGTHVGASTAILALALADHAQAIDKPRLISVDIQDVNDPVNGPWKQLGLRGSPAQVLRELRCADLVSFVAQHSLDYLKHSREQFDLIFLDGDHEADVVYEEIAASLNLLAPGGVILLHDFFPEGQPLWDNGVVIAGPWEAVQRVKADGVTLESRPLGRLPWPTKRGSNATSLAVLFAAD